MDSVVRKQTFYFSNERISATNTYIKQNDMHLSLMILVDSQNLEYIR